MLFVYFLLCAAVSALAQTGTGNIQGTVKDAADAVVPGAIVNVVHTATSRQYRSPTNDVGFYLFPTLQAEATSPAHNLSGRPPVGQASSMCWKLLYYRLPLGPWLKPA